MEPDGRALDAISSAAAVVRAIDDIETKGEEEHDALLCALLCAAWGSSHAQNQ